MLLCRQLHKSTARAGSLPQPTQKPTLLRSPSTPTTAPCSLKLELSPRLSVVRARPPPAPLQPPPSPPCAALKFHSCSCSCSCSRRHQRPGSRVATVVQPAAAAMAVGCTSQPGQCGCCGSKSKGTGGRTVSESALRVALDLATELIAQYDVQHRERKYCAIWHLAISS
jgi:hypothetical protein